MAENEPAASAPVAPETKAEEPAPSKYPRAFLEKPDPSIIGRHVELQPTGDIDLDDFVSELSIETSLIGADKNRIEGALKSSIDTYTKSRGISTEEFQEQLRLQRIEPQAIATKLFEGKRPSEVIQGLKDRTLAGQTEAQRKTQIRADAIADIGYERQKANIGRTVEKTGEIAEELVSRGDEPVFEEESAGFFGTDLDKAKNIQKQGEFSWNENAALNAAFDRLAKEGDEKSKRLVYLRDKYKDAEMGAKDYIDDRADDILKWRNIKPPASLTEAQEANLSEEEIDKALAKIKVQNDKHEAAYRSARKRAVKEIATWKTLGIWTAPTFIRYKDPSALSADQDLSFDQALAPTVEIVGLDRKNSPVLRAQSSMQWGLEINDLLQSAAIGAFTEDHADLGQRMLRGIAKRRELFEASLDSDLAKTGTGTKIALGVAGFAGSILFPDLTFGAAGAYKAASKRLSKVISKSKLLKIADSHEQAAEKLASALQSGDRSAMREAADIASGIRGDAKVAMDRVDQSDFDAARRLGRENKDILATREGNELADSLPGRLGDERMNLHPSVRRRQAREGGKEAKEGDFQEAAGIEYRRVYDYGDQLDEVDSMRALVNAEDGAVYERFVRKGMVGEGGTLKAALSFVRDIEKVAPEAAATFNRLLKDYALLARDPRKWSSDLNRELDLATRDIPRVDRTELFTKFTDLVEQSETVAINAIDSAGDFETMGKLIDRADEAIKTNIESRAIAHAFDRSLIHGELGLKSSPIIVESVAKVKEIQELSDEGISFMDQAIKFFGATKDEAIEAARIFDLAATRWGEQTGQNATKWWQTRLKDIQSKDDFAKRFGFEDSGTVFSSVYHPAYQAQAALPAGYRLAGVGEATRKLIGNPSDVRRQLTKWLGKNYPEVNLGPLYGRTVRVTIDDDVIIPLVEGSPRLDPNTDVIFRLLNTNSANYERVGESLFTVKGRGYKKGSQGMYDFNQDVLSDFIDGEDAAFMSGFFDELQEAGLLVEEPQSWKIIDEATGKAISEGDNLSSVTGTALQKLVDDGVIVRSAEDIEIGHALRVGPINIGMDVDSVDQAIGGYNFEYGAGWIDGVSFFRSEGKKTSVPFTSDEFRVLALGKFTQFTHNHPNYSWFSGGTGDLGFMPNNNLNEMRVVWPDGTMIKIEAPDGWGELAINTKLNMTDDLVDSLDQSGIIRKANFAKTQAWKRDVGSFVLGPSKRKANNARKESWKTEREFTDRDWAIAYTEEANRRLIELAAREDYGVTLRISVRQPEESRKLGLSRSRPSTERLTPALALEGTEGADIFFQGVQRQPGVEFKEIGEGLVELTTDAVRAAGGEGLTFRVVDGALSVDAVSIPAELQGRGIGSDLYRNALAYARDKGFGFASDVSPSRDAVAVYERLISEGAPLVRKMVRAPDGAMVRQYVADADSLKKAAQPPAAAMTDTPEFKTWSGGLPIVKASDDIPEGGAIVEAYHGTASDFDAFDQPFNWVATDAATANRYAQFQSSTWSDIKPQSIMPLYARVEAPFDADKLSKTTTIQSFVTQILKQSPKGIDGLKGDKDKILAIRKRIIDGAKKNSRADSFERYELWHDSSYIFGEDGAKAIKELLEATGFDSIKMTERGAATYGVLNPTQLKSKFNVGAFDSTDPRVLYQTGDDVARGATEFLEDGKAIIYALEQPDFTTLIHEMGHILRRDLGPEDFEKVGSWVTSLGADVQIRAGRFIGEPEEVRKAEEFFAEAFEQYIKDGEPPVEDLRGAFERMKDFMTQAVTYLLPNAKVTPEMKQVFDDLLVTAKPDEAVLPRVTRMLKQSILGKTPGADFDTVEVISKEAYRLGIDNADYDTLMKQLEDTGKIKLDGKVFADRFEDGADEFSSADLADLRSKLQAEIATEKITYAPGAATRAFSQAVSEMSPSEKIEQLLRGDGASGRFSGIVKSSFIGGDVVSERGLEAFHPAARQRIETATRQVKQGTAEGIRLVGEATTPEGRKNLIDFLTGDNVVYKLGGRDVLTSGHNSAAAVFTGLRKFIDDAIQTNDDMKELVELANHKAEGKSLASFSFGEAIDKEGTKLSKGAAERAWNQLFRGNKTSRFVRDLLEAVAPETAIGANPIPADFFDLTEILLYHTGHSSRDGLKFAGDGKYLVDNLMKEIEGLYGKPASMRIAILMATHGHADRARKLWSGLGLAIDQESFTMMQRWLNGEDIPADQVVKVKKLVNRFGLRPDMVEEKLLDTTFYIPRAARKRLGDALTRGIDPDVVFSEDNISGLKGSFLRYNKMRMTRGGIALRQRYFLMNTIDHFAQMAMINGFRPALSSTIRLLAQDVMVLPGVARTIDTLSRTGVMDPKKAENVRKSLQKYGDKLGQFFSASKYNISVNPIMEGSEGFFRVGGNVYQYKEIRDIAVQEGIFASFDTTQLSNSVKRAGRSMLDQQADEMSVAGRSKAATKNKLEDTSEFLTQVVSDTAEAWGERERLGAMIALMETGVPPRVAARLTIDALYDYAGSMTKMDRHWLVSLALPFWAFQKNANRQFLDTLFSPSGVYRMGVIRRGTDRTADALTEIMWNSVSDEYGVDMDALQEADPVLYGDYLTLKQTIHDAHDGDVPEDVKIGINMWLRGENERIMEEGRYRFSYDAFKGGAFSGAEVKYASFVRPFPSKSARASYLRPRAGVLIPFSLKEKATREYYTAIRAASQGRADAHPYTEVFFPDSTINAGMRHLSNMAAFYVLAGTKLTDMVVGFEDTSIREVPLMNPLKEVADLERAPLIGEFAKTVAGKEGYPRRIHPYLVPLFETVFSGVRLLHLEPKADIYNPVDKREGIEYQQERVYMFPGHWSLAFDNSVGEINKILFEMTSEGLSPAERTAARGKLLHIARGITGIQTAESSGFQTVRREGITRLIETDKPD